MVLERVAGWRCGFRSRVRRAKAVSHASARCPESFGVPCPCPSCCSRRTDSGRCSCAVPHQRCALDATARGISCSPEASSPDGARARLVTGIGCGQPGVRRRVR
jgi:hypothetical protein